MQNLPTIAIDWANVNWLYVTVLAIFVFLSVIIGTLLSFRHIFYGAVLSALLLQQFCLLELLSAWPAAADIDDSPAASTGYPTQSGLTVSAHAKSPTYVAIAIQKITDPEAYKPLPEKGRAAAEAAGGHYLIRTGNITGLDGVAPNGLLSSNSIASKKRKLGTARPPEGCRHNPSQINGPLAFIVEGLGK